MLSFFKISGIVIAACYAHTNRGNMKFYKIVAYAAAGIITGLLLENCKLRCQTELAKRALDKKVKTTKKEG